MYRLYRVDEGNMDELREKIGHDFDFSMIAMPWIVICDDLVVDKTIILDSFENEGDAYRYLAKEAVWRKYTEWEKEMEEELHIDGDLICEFLLDYILAEEERKAIREVNNDQPES